MLPARVVPEEGGVSRRSSMLSDRVETEKGAVIDDSGPGLGKTEDKSDRKDIGKMLYGCQHYRRRCKIRAACCNEVFTCRHCHNEAKFALTDPKERHEIVRQDITHVICAVCNNEQEVAEFCLKCGVKFGDHFCKICNFFEDDTTKKQFHCHDCGICRIGGGEHLFHGPKCGSCFSVNISDNHECVESSMKNYCPICHEVLIDSVRQTNIMKCGHSIHMDCFSEMVLLSQFRCPLCWKSVVDMSDVWRRFDREIEAAIMPEEYHFDVFILCYDCNQKSTAMLHMLGHKCKNCGSYNTCNLTCGVDREV